MRENYWLWER